MPRLFITPLIIVGVFTRPHVCRNANERIFRLEVRYGIGAASYTNSHSGRCGSRRAALQTVPQVEQRGTDYLDEVVELPSATPGISLVCHRKWVFVLP